MGVFIWLLGRMKKPAGYGESQSQSTAIVKTQVDLTILEELYQKYDRRLVEESELEIRKALINHHGEEREQVFVRLLTSLMWGSMFGAIWYVIYRSQLRALIEINRQPSTREAIFQFYAEAAVEYPNLYAHFTFEKWLLFLRHSILVRDEGEFLQVTVRGQGFLKYMVDWGLSVEDRPF
jgi:hypothetical protein